MDQKSVINLVFEGMQIKENFFSELQDLDNKYKINGNLFYCGDKQGNLNECRNGFLGITGEYDTLEEVRKDFNIYCQAVLISEGKYIVGNLYKNLSDVKEENIIDVENMKRL